MGRPAGGQRRRLLVTGGSGYLGRALLTAAPPVGWDAVGTYLTAPAGGTRLDVRDEAAVERAISHVRPHAVIHTAYVQSGPAMRAVNVDGAANVAGAAARHGSRLVHLSTDVVFDGELRRPYREEDDAVPVTDYGRAKLDAEHAVARRHPDAVIVRTSLIYGGATPGPQERLVADALAGRNDVAFYEDEIRSPAFAPDLARALLELAAGGQRGVLHVAGPEHVSRLELARLLATAAGADAAVLRSTSSAQSTVRRPRNCSLDSARAYGQLTTRMRGPREALTSAPMTAL
jgi:dTDP-4-dehydrorhamnose reductase